MARLGLYVNLAACTGCKACQLACKDRNDLPVGVRWRRVVEVEGGTWEKRGQTWVPFVLTYFVSTACNHCEKPICVEVCPSKAAARRDDGIVLIDADRCLGCRYCEWACPYRAPQFDGALGVMTKCTLCVDDVTEGKPPACVQACQMRVLEFGEIEELRRKHGDFIEVHPLPDRSLTDPSAAVTPHHEWGPEAGPLRIGNEEEI